MPPCWHTPFRKLVSLILLSIFIKLTKAKDDGLCDVVEPLDIYLLTPTSAHVSRTRLREVRELTKSLFNEADFADNNVRVTAINYKKSPQVAFSYDDYLPDKESLGNAIDREIIVKARATVQEAPPTFASQGLQYFMDQYVQDTESGRRRQGVPAILIFYVIESLQRGDLNNMASSLVSISSKLDVFSFIFIANPNGQQENESPVFSLPHKSWNALAVDDKSNIDKYKPVLRQALCRCSHNNLCMMLKEEPQSKDKGSFSTDKSLTMERIQEAASLRTATNNKQAQPDRIVARPNACCDALIYSQNYDDRVQRCCPKYSQGNPTYDIRFIDEECDSDY